MDKKLIERLFEKGLLVQQDTINQNQIDASFFEKIEKEADLLILNDDYIDLIAQQTSLIDWYDIDVYRTLAEMERNDELYQKHLQQFRTNTLTITSPPIKAKQQVSSLETTVNRENNSGSFRIEEGGCLLESKSSESLIKEETPFVPSLPLAVTVVSSVTAAPRKYEVEDFAKIFRYRFKFLEKLMQNRLDLPKITTIARLLSKKEREEVSLIGIIDEIGETKTGNLVVSLEDQTGKIKVIISKNKRDLYLHGKDLVIDEVIGVRGISSDKIVFAEQLVWPEIPLDHELKLGEKEEYALFLSDIHVGSTLFLKKEFNKFLEWLCGDYGTEVQREIAKKTKYLFIAGDLVDGVGIYPNQEEELEIKNITNQYQEVSRLLQKVPSHISMIICPGNHDVVQLAEPQPAFYQQFAPGLFSLPNITLVTNPAVVNIGKTNTFGGFDVLMYHGYSFDYYVANVESIRSGGGYHRSDLIMKFLLKRRHLAPSFRSTPYFPAPQEDPLLIKSIPDFFITGHIHYSSVANYRGITMISGSCWQDKTSFQEKLGHEPEPARVPAVNLKTREVRILRFG